MFFGVLATWMLHLDRLHVPTVAHGLWTGHGSSRYTDSAVVICAALRRGCSVAGGVPWRQAVQPPRHYTSTTPPHTHSVQLGRTPTGAKQRAGRWLRPSACHSMERCIKRAYYACGLPWRRADTSACSGSRGCAVSVLHAVRLSCGVLQ